MTKKRPTSAADRAANASTPDGETPAGDPELAALVRRDAPRDDADASTSVGDPELAALVRPDSEPGVDADTALFPVAAVTADELPARPPRRRSLFLRFGVAFVVGFLLTVGVGAGALYAWGQQYEGRVLPGVRVGSTELGGLTREQAEAAIANAYGSLGTGQITLTGPDGHVTTISYADLGRGPDTSAVLDAALAAGRLGDSLASLIGAPKAAMHGVTLDVAVTYDRDKLAAAVETLGMTTAQTPVDASVSAGEGGTFTVSRARDGRLVDKAALTAALDQQLAALGTPASITMAVPVVPLAPAVATASAETAKAEAERMSADVVVAHGKDTWKIAGTSLAPLISFSTAADGSITPVFAESGLDPILKKLAKKVDRAAKDAGLKLAGGRIVATGASREGRKLNAEGMKAAIISEVAARETGAAASPVEAVVKAIAPKLTTADAKAFAPKMKVISSYSVWYQHIINNHCGGNIEGPATVLHGTVVPAGAKFDFWKEVGNLRNAPGIGPGQRDRRWEDHRHRRVRRRHLHHVDDAVQCGVPGRHGAARPEEPQRVHQPVSGGPRCHRVDRRQHQADHELQERHQVPDHDHAGHQPQRRQVLADVQDLERPERPESHGHQHGHPAGRARGPQDREGSDQAGRVPLLQQRRGERRQGVDHRDDLRPRQGPLAQALLLELPSRGRRHHRGDQRDLTPA